MVVTVYTGTYRNANNDERPYRLYQIGGAYIVPNQLGKRYWTGADALRAVAPDWRQARLLSTYRFTYDNGKVSNVIYSAYQQC